MYVCDVCGKGVLRGNAVSHAKNKTKRIYSPNLHVVKALINGQPKIIRACTKCLRRVEKAPKRDLSKVILDTQKTQKTQSIGKSEKSEENKKKIVRAKKTVV